MTLGEVAEKMGLSAASGCELPAARVFTGAYCSDMLSDVIAGARRGDVLITILTHSNVIGVAVLVGLAAVIVTGGHQPGEDMLAAARREGVPVLVSPKNSFEVAGRLYGLTVF